MQNIFSFLCFGDLHDTMGYVAVVSVWCVGDPQGGTGYVAVLPACGPPTWKALCSHVCFTPDFHNSQDGTDFTALLATLGLQDRGCYLPPCDFSPALGTPEMGGVMKFLLMSSLSRPPKVEGVA